MLNRAFPHHIRIYKEDDIHKQSIDDGRDGNPYIIEHEWA